MTLRPFKTETAFGFARVTAFYNMRRNRRDKAVGAIMFCLACEGRLMKVIVGIGVCGFRVIIARHCRLRLRLLLPRSPSPS